MAMSKFYKLAITEENSEKEAPITDVGAVMATETSSPEPEDGLKGVDYHDFPADTIPDVWGNIFEKLDPKDKITFSETCAKWHYWAAPKRMTFLFTEIVDVIIKALTEQQTLKCRSICRSWTQDIDHELENQASSLLIETEIDQDEIRQNWETDIANVFWSSKKIEQFLVEMASHNGNPFPGRTILFGFNIPLRRPILTEWLELKRTFCRKAIELLEAFGSHVYIANFEFCPLHTNSNIVLEATETIEYLRTSLSHLPNLKRLNISGLDKLFLLDEARDFYRNNPLPRLPHMEMVYMDYTCNAVKNWVLETSALPATLKRISIQPHPREVEFSSGPIFNFPNLEALDVVLSIEDLERFGTLMGSTPPLKAIRLKFVQNLQDFQRVFRSLEVFAESLKIVSIDENYSRNSLRDAIATGFSINLPKLERLELVRFDGPLDPLCRLESLKYLGVKLSRLQEWEGSTVNFYGFENRMEESNVWEKISSLQKLSFEGMMYPAMKYHKVYTRPMLSCATAILGGGGTGGVLFEDEPWLD
ncbi:unnamed protein product [Orchesella dallaii]